MNKTITPMNSAEIEQIGAADGFIADIIDGAQELLDAAKQAGHDLGAAAHRLYNNLSS